MLASSFVSFQATPRASHASVALGVVPNLDIDFDLGLGRCLGQRRAQDPSRIFHEALPVQLMGRSVIQFDPRGAFCMADGTFSHFTEF